MQTLNNLIAKLTFVSLSAQIVDEVKRFVSKHSDIDSKTKILQRLSAILPSSLEYSQLIADPKLSKNISYLVSIVNQILNSYKIMDNSLQIETCTSNIILKLLPLTSVHYYLIIIGKLSAKFTLDAHVYFSINFEFALNNINL